ncbi:MAG TPA: ATP-binding protein [Chloroflexia bacterium]|nr:ATP-binding protein [Chloroflexia bacterium]
MGLSSSQSKKPVKTVRSIPETKITVHKYNLLKTTCLVMAVAFLISVVLTLIIALYSNEWRVLSVGIVDLLGFLVCLAAFYLSVQQEYQNASWMVVTATIFGVLSATALFDTYLSLMLIFLVPASVSALFFTPRYVLGIGFITLALSILIYFLQHYLRVIRPFVPYDPAINNVITLAIALVVLPLVLGMLLMTNYTNLRLEQEHSRQLEQDKLELEKTHAALYASEERFRIAAECASDLLYEWDLQTGKSQWFGISSSSTNHPSGLTYDQQLDWKKVIHPEDFAAVDASLEQFLAEGGTGRWEMEYRIILADGSVRYWHDRGIPLRDAQGEFIRWIGASTDITERRLIDEERLRLNEILEQRVTERTAQLATVNQALEVEVAERKRLAERLQSLLDKEKEISQLKTRLVTMTSHEYRTPLTVIMTSLELLENYEEHLQPRKRAEILARAKLAVHRMNNLLDDLLTLGRAESGSVVCYPVALDLIPFCESLVEEYRMNLDSHYQLEFLLSDAPVMAWADEKLLRHILGNLLSNAIKYSPEGGPISLELDYEKGQAIFRIRDHGIGITPEDLPYIFEPFKRAQNVGAINGTGLGLSIVRQYIEICNGNISVESAPGSGTLFTVVIPVHKNLINKTKIAAA